MLTACLTCRRVLRPGNAGLAGNLPNSVPFPVLMAGTTGGYQPIASGSLGASSRLRFGFRLRLG